MSTTAPTVANPLQINPRKGLSKLPTSLHCLLTTLSTRGMSPVKEDERVAHEPLLVLLAPDHRTRQPRRCRRAGPRGLWRQLEQLQRLRRLRRSSSGEKPIVGLITKTDTNPFFVKMKEGAQQAADKAGLTLQSFAGKQDGDNEAQVQAIENLISAGAKGILITPSDSKAIVPEIDKAKQAGHARRRARHPHRPGRTRSTPPSPPTTSRPVC